MFLLQIWFIGRTLASQAGKAGSTPVICSQKPLILLGFSTISNRRVIKTVIKTYVRLFSRILEFWDRAEYLALFIFIFSISVIMIFRTKYICVSHLPHNQLIVYLVVQKDAPICFSYFMRRFVVYTCVFANPF